MCVFDEAPQAFGYSLGCIRPLFVLMGCRWDPWSMPPTLTCWLLQKPLFEPLLTPHVVQSSFQTDVCGLWSYVLCRSVKNLTMT